MQPIAVDAAPVLPTEPQLMPVDEGGPPIVPLPETVVNSRTAKWAFGLNGIKNYDEIYTALNTGQEPLLRQEAAGRLKERENIDINEVLLHAIRQKQGPLDPKELSSVVDAVKFSNQWMEPRNVLEKVYSDRYLNVLYGTPKDEPGSFIGDAKEQYPEQTKQIFAAGKDYMLRQQVLGTAYENAKAAYDQQSKFGAAVDVGKDILSLGMYSEYQERGIIPNTSFWKGLLGTNKEAGRLELFRKSMPEFLDIVQQIQDISKNNPHLAMKILESMQSPANKDIDNLFSGLNIATIPGVGTLGKAGVKLMTNTATAVGGAIKGSSSALPATVSAQISAGNLKEGAIQQATIRTSGELSGTYSPIQAVTEGLPEHLQAQVVAFKNNAGKGPGAQEINNRLIAETEKSSTNLINTLETLMRGSRTPAPLATEDMMRLLAEAAAERYSGSSARVIGTNLATVPHANIRYWELQLGHHDGTLFQSKDYAAWVARDEGVVLKGEFDSARQSQLGNLIDNTMNGLALHRMALNPTDEARAFIHFPETSAEIVSKMEKNLVAYQEELAALRAKPGATIEQKGAGFYISRYAPFDETDKIVRQNLHSTPESQVAQRSLAGAALNHIRTGGETLSKDAMTNAYIAVYGPSNIHKMMADELKGIQSLRRFSWLPFSSSKKNWKDFNDTLQMGRTEGMFENLPALEDHYQRAFGRYPTEREASAYFAAKRYGQLETAFRDLRQFVQEHIAGSETWNVSFKDGGGQSISSGGFKGILRKDGQIGLHDEGILIVGKGLDDTKVVTGHYFGGTVKPTGSEERISFMKNINDQIARGEKQLIEVVYPLNKPFKTFGDVGDKHVKYVLTNKAEVSPLEFTRSKNPYSSLYDQDYPFFLKQGNIVNDVVSNTARYIGDITVSAIKNAAQGREFLKNLEEVRQHVVAGNYGAARIAANKGPVEWSKQAQWYNQTIGPDGKIMPPKLNMNEPIRLVPGDKLTVNMPESDFKTRFGDRFRDDTRGNIILKNFIKDEHDNFGLYEIRNDGTRNNPLYKYEPASYISALDSLNRATKRIVNSTYMDDYKTFTIEHWIQQAKDHLNASAESIAHSPAYHFFNTEWKAGTKPEVIYQLNDAKWKAQAIWGTPSVTDNFLDRVAQNMYDNIYEKGGLHKFKLPAAWTIAKSSDIAGIIKAATFHPVIGMLNPTQLFVQSTGYVTIAGIEGFGRAASSSAAAGLTWIARMNPNTLPTLDAMISKMSLPSIRNMGFIRWKPGELTESYHAGVSTGFFRVGNEMQLAENVMSSNIVKSAGQEMLDFTTVFFRRAEENMRYGAWHAAYRRFRDANPTGKLTEENMREIFNRANLLAGDMSIAAKSNLQRGPGAFTNQFLAYNMRFVEMLTGKRLTTTERMSLAGTYATLFGVSAANITGVPLGDIFREKAIEHGYTADPDGWAKFGMEGLAQNMVRWATGHQVNLGQRYADFAYGPLRDGMVGDKGAWDIIGGAPASNLKNLWKSTDGIRNALVSMVMNSDEHFPITKDMALQPLKNISSVNIADRWWEAVNTTDWLSRKGEKLDTGISPLAATIMSLTGVQPQTAANIQPLHSIEKHRKEMWHDAEESYLRVGKMWLRALEARDVEQARDFGKQMRLILINKGYPPEQYSNLAHRLEQYSRTTYDRSVGDVYLQNKNIPMDNRDTMNKAYRSLQGLK